MRNALVEIEASTSVKDIYIAILPLEHGDQDMVTDEEALREILHVHDILDEVPGKLEMHIQQPSNAERKEPPAKGRGCGKKTQ